MLFGASYVKLDDPENCDPVLNCIEYSGPPGDPGEPPKRYEAVNAWEELCAHDEVPNNDPVNDPVNTEAVIGPETKSELNEASDPDVMTFFQFGI